MRKESNAGPDLDEKTGMRLSIQRVGFGLIVTVMALAATGAVKGDGTWRGLTIAPEHRCAPYDRDDYPYSQSVETHIIADMGGRVHGPYTGRHFGSRRDTDIEHMVATSETHDSGLCVADAATKRRFARDLLNLTLAAPAVNRHQGRKDSWRTRTHSPTGGGQPPAAGEKTTRS